MTAMIARVCLVLFFTGLFNDCGRSLYQQYEPYGRRSLMRNMFDKGEILWVYSSDDSLATSKFISLSQEIQASIRDNGLKIIPRADTLVSREDLESYPLFITANLNNQSIWQFFENKLPYGFQNDSLITPLGSHKLSTLHVWSLSAYPHPYHSKFPLYIYSGLSDLEIAQHLYQRDVGSWRWMFYNAWSYELFEGEKRTMMGYLKENEKGNWTFDRYNHWDYTSGKALECVSGHFEVKRHGEIDEARLSDLLNKLEEGCLALTNRLDLPQPSDAVILHVYPSAEDKGLQLLNTEQMHADFEKRSLYAVVHDAFSYHNTFAANQLLLRTQLGQPTQTALESGLAARYTEPWKDDGLLEWGSRLHRANALLSLEELVSVELFDQSSSLIRQLSSALWVDFLWKKWGKDKFLASYGSWSPNPQEVNTLKYDWEQYLNDLSGYGVLSKKKPHHKSEDIRLKGFNFAHEGYRIYNGYISRKAEEAIESTRQHGSNAIAIIPYTGTRSTQQPQPFRFSSRAGSENDESLIFSTHYAHKRGMKVMLKPQIWVSGAWPGDIRMQSQEDWDLFFQYYRKWIMHYALMASLHDIEIFCAGVELVHATLEQPDQWRDLLEDMRKIYPGKVVYAANWGREFEQLSFWDELDYIGIDCYYPLSDDEKASRAELKHNFEAITHKLIAKSQKYDKPLIFTEIGFRSIEAPWQQPHAHPDGKAPNHEHQAMCYDVVSEVLKDQSWYQGVFWWKWPSYLEYSANNPTAFTPYGKPASEIVKKWFSEDS